MEEKAQQAKAGELEIARLRAQQEQAQDLQAQADALRAKRFPPTPAPLHFLASSHEDSSSKPLQTTIR